MALILLIVINLGREAFEAGIFRLAELEYRRSLFFNEEIKREDSLRLAICFLREDRYALASTLLEGKGDKGSHILAKYYLARGSYHSAVVELMDLMLSDHSDSIREMLGLALLLQGNIKEASSYLPIQNLSLKNDKMGLLLSSLIPGTGEIYGGKPLLGLIDLTMNGATAYLLFRSIKNRNLLDGLIILYFLSFRFYNGSRINAMKAVEGWNQKEIEGLIRKQGWDRWLSFY
ncbi:MAG TPA: hypothetical protein EYP24_02710 [bacterium (Candidatus Stahlbacteria)]|nr:hypothetical protein [Candidatus Stahlbacteria bacterium]